MQYFIHFFLSFCFIQILNGQQITHVATKWDDSFKEWILYDAEKEVEGHLEMRWILNNDWGKWDYRLGEESGMIDMKWRESPEEWDIKGFDEIVYARTVWPGDLGTWRIKGEELTITFESRYTFRKDEWRIKTDRYGEFVIYTEFEGDPRDWVIYDDLSSEITFTMKMAMIFLAIYNGSPKV